MLGFLSVWGAGEGDGPSAGFSVALRRIRFCNRLRLDFRGCFDVSGGMANFRLKSIRAARRQIELALSAHAKGQISSVMLNARVGALKTWTEIFLVEQELMKLGMDFEAANHPMGLDGGAQFEPFVEALVTKRVSKTVEGPKGSTTEESASVVRVGPEETFGD